MMTHIDLNSDMGEDGSPEGIAIEEEMMLLITSVNIACGGHAGTEDLMRRTAERAATCGVSIGAHPGFPDPKYFGRSEQRLTSQEIESLVASQIHTLTAVLAKDQFTLRHVKPHGALYNMAGRDPDIARAIVQAVQGIDRRLILYALAHSELVKAAQWAGLTVIQEAFVDRAYRGDRSLVPRSERGAVFETEAEVRRQLHRLMTGSVMTIDGSAVQIHAESLCLHTDTPQAVPLARTIRQEIQSAGIRIAAPL